MCHSFSIGQNCKKQSSAWATGASCPKFPVSTGLHLVVAEPTANRLVLPLEAQQKQITWKTPSWADWPPDWRFQAPALKVLTCTSAPYLLDGCERSGPCAIALILPVSLLLSLSISVRSYQGLPNFFAKLLRGERSPVAEVATAESFSVSLSMCEGRKKLCHLIQCQN